MSWDHSSGKKWSDTEGVCRWNRTKKGLEPFVTGKTKTTTVDRRREVPITTDVFRNKELVNDMGSLRRFE